ncbi:MAG TPA: 4Fe-4S dicluster domain-containing protein [Kofleriaceae bacterium]|nr:4Fe-4S dicluster domain-containing protein [Kofleriaceae bacterium]
MDLVIDRAEPANAAVMLSPELQGDYAELRKLGIFDGIPNAELANAIRGGGVGRRVVERDAFVLDPIGLASGETAPIIFVAEGQIAAAVFEEHELSDRRAQQLRWQQMTDDERKEESLLKPPPLARTARKNVALFVPGDLFNSAALTSARGAPIAFYAAAPAVLCTIDHGTIAELATKHPFFEARFRRAIQLSRERLHNVVGVKQEILDFFVRQGISVSGEMVRVRQLDLCIDCKLCEEACEERYGARRLTLGGYQLGMLDFVYTCRTCTDQRCIDPCEYDSIKFDAKKGEVVINEATCTGCTACAQACPYGAIDMVEVFDHQSPTYKGAFKDRLEAKGALAFGGGAPRMARPRRIANKCDHCMTYGDQACVSACPTGSLIEVNAYDLFRERTAAAAAIAKAGYDQEPERPRDEVLPTDPFTRGLAVRNGGEAKIRRGRFWPIAFWSIGLIAWALCLAEILLRLYAPTYSIQFELLRGDPDMQGLPVDAILERIEFHAGDRLAVWCGVGGTALMFIAAIYPMFRRIRAFRWMASNTMWFDFHMMAGIVGPMFIMLHSALTFASWGGAGFWSMGIVVVSGLIGRYVYTQVPDMMNGRELEELDHERAFAKVRAQNPVAMSEIERELAAHQGRADVIAQTGGVLRALVWIFAEDLRRPGRWWTRRKRLARLGMKGAQRRDLVRRASRAMRIHRSRVLAPKAQLLLHSWKKVHVPFTFILTAFTVVHVWDVWARAW